MSAGPKAMSLKEWEVLAQRVGADLKLLHSEALKHGDPHEARHLWAALVAGSSDNCKDGRDCVMDRPGFVVPRAGNTPR